MKRQFFYRKILVVGIIILFLSAGFVSASREIKNLSLGNPITITAGAPTKDGKWTVHITHTGTSSGGTPYTNGTWTFTIQTHAGMTAEEKAEEMRTAINNRDNCPLTAGGNGANVVVTPDNGDIFKYASTSTDGQMVHGTAPKTAGCCFTGTSSAGSVTIDAGGFLATTTTNGKTLMQIHKELYNQLLGQGMPVIMDPSLLAIYIMVPLPMVGIDSDDDMLTALVTFTEYLGVEPFGGYTLEYKI
jgi:hypothetical protein